MTTRFPGSSPGLSFFQNPSNTGFTFQLDSSVNQNLTLFTLGVKAIFIGQKKMKIEMISLSNNK